MAARPGYAQPGPGNPFVNPPLPQQQPQPQQYHQRRRDYDADSDISDPYGSRNGSTAHLAAHSQHDHSGQYDSPCAYNSSFSPYARRLAIPMQVRTLVYLHGDVFLASHCRRASVADALFHFFSLPLRRSAYSIMLMLHHRFR
jgi:hypothetical protein